MKRLLIILILLGALGGGGYYLYTHHAEQQTASTTARTGARGGGFGRGGPRRNDPDVPVPILSATAETGDVPIYLDALGTVQAYQTVSVRAMIDGPLLEVDFKEGQDVRQGDVLAKIDPRPYQAALDSAVAKKQQDEATLANSRLDYIRYQKLASNGASQQQIDTARSQVAQNEAIVRADQAAIDTARTNLSYTTIVSPIDGRTGIRQVDAGNIIHSSDTNPLTVITQLKPISVLFTLPQQNLAAVTNAMAEGKPPVLAQAGGGPTGRLLDRGELTVLDNQVDTSTGTIKLKSTFPNEQLKLWPGGFVNVRLLVETRRGATTVPTSAVQRGPQGPYVFIVKPDNTVKRQAITTGHEDEQRAIVTAGLTAGDKVVTDGAQRLNDGSKVAVAGPDGNAPAAVPRERTAPGTAERAPRRSAS